MAIQVNTRFVAPSAPTLPALGVHIVRLVDSYMIWVGVTTETAETVDDAPRSGSLCRDWACAMPAAAATTLYRTSTSDVALAMAQRLATRTGKQVFLSVDIASALQHARLLWDAEKAIIEALASSSSSSSSY